MKSIIAAIGAVLRAVGSLMKSAISLPGRMLGAVLGGPLVGPPAGDSPFVEDLARKVAEDDAAIADNSRKVANAVWHWLMDGLIAGGPVAVPKWWPRAVQAWAPGLTATEAEKLVSADKKALESHLRGLFAVPGVRKVQPLPAVKEWSPTPLYVEPAPGWAAQFATPVRGRGPA